MPYGDYSYPLREPKQDPLQLLYCLIVKPSYYRDFVPKPDPDHDSYRAYAPEYYAHCHPVPDSDPALLLPVRQLLQIPLA